ncbi:MAG TPA: lysophospholipid acyltransferase family protein [Rhodocyclaceae bacterium]|nr:lysophospholipid acyltransferase family protein [Rhodocyclaceae bacterium]
MIRAIIAPLWMAYEYLTMGLGLGVLASLCLLWLPWAMVLHMVLPRRQGQRLGRFAIRTGFRAYVAMLGACCACRFDLDDLDTLRADEPLVLAANHPSLLDAVLIISRVPDVACVMKATLMDNPLFGAAARLARYIRNNAPLSMILCARQELQSGAKVLIFPESSRTSNFPMDACAPTLGLISARADVPVQTLCIEFSSPYLGKAWPLFRRPALPLHCRIRLGKRFPPPTDLHAFAVELETYFREELMSCHA